MKLIARILRASAKLRFKALKHACIKDIPTDRFKQIMEGLIASGWKKVYVYDGLDAWIDYGKVILKGESCELIFEWDNWTEGSVEGPAKIIEELAAKHSLKLNHDWRWSEYDQKS